MTDLTKNPMHRKKTETTHPESCCVCLCCLWYPLGSAGVPPLPESLLLTLRDNGSRKFRVARHPPPPLPLSGKRQLREAVLDVETDCCCYCCCCCTCRPLRLPSPGEKLCVEKKEGGCVCGYVCERMRRGGGGSSVSAVVVQVCLRTM